MRKVLVAGEALVDFIPGESPRSFVCRPGGSPLNVAVGLSRLGVPTAFLTKISYDYFGNILLSYLKENKVDLAFVLKEKSPTLLAFVVLQGDNEPEFIFYGTETADMNLKLEDIPLPLPDDIGTIHIGSLAMVREPCATTLSAFVFREHARKLISFDPNIRPQAIQNIAVYRKRFLQLLSVTDVLKLSKRDAEYLFPDFCLQEKELVQEWLGLGPKLVVVTLGPNGARAYSAKFVVDVEALPTKVVDSVGAGDSFMAALLAAFYYLGVLDKRLIGSIDRITVERALRFAARAAAITCTRQGADLPYISETGLP